MALLNFKHGFLTNMKTDSPVINPGTVYITRDERAMYVDLPPYEKDGITWSAKRIRIGDLHTFEYLDEMKEAIKNDMTELTTSALYFAEKDNSTNNKTINALLKWNGTDFIQLNEISDVTANMNDLVERVGTLETTANELSEAIELLNNTDPTKEGSIAHSLKIESDARNTADEVHTQNIATNAGNIAKNTEAISKVEEDLGTLNTAFESFTDTVSSTYLTKTDASETYLTKEDASETYATKVELNTVKSDLIGISSDDKSTKTTIYAAINAAEAASEAAGTAQTTADSGVEKADNAQRDINNYITSNNNALAGVKATAEAAATQTDLEAEIKRATEAEEANTVEIGTLKTTTESLDDRLAQVELYFDTAGRGTEVIDTFNEIVEYIDSDKSGAEEMLGSINNLKDRMDTAEGEIDNLQIDLGTETTAREQGDEAALTAAKTYTETKLTWGTF